MSARSFVTWASVCARWQRIARAARSGSPASQAARISVCSRSNRSDGTPSPRKLQIRAWGVAPSADQIDQVLHRRQLVELHVELVMLICATVAAVAAGAVNLLLVARGSEHRAGIVTARRAPQPASRAAALGLVNPRFWRWRPLLSVYRVRYRVRPPGRRIRVHAGIFASSHAVLLALAAQPACRLLPHLLGVCLEVPPGTAPETLDFRGFPHAPERTRTSTDHIVHKALNLARLPIPPQARGRPV